MRKSERTRFPDTLEGTVSYFFESLDFNANERKLNAYYAEFQPIEGEAPAHAHEGAEFIYLLTGRLRLTIGRQQHEISEGDAVYFDASVPHSYRRHGKSRCGGIVVTTR